MCFKFSPSVHMQRPPQASMGLDTMLFGVSGSWDDMDATSLPVEFDPGPPSEKLTCGRHGAAVQNHGDLLGGFLLSRVFILIVAYNKGFPYK